MTDATIRFAQDTDLPGLRAVEDEFRRHGTSPWALMTDDTFLTKIRAGEMLVAQRGDELVGYMMFTLMWGFPWIEYVRLLEAHRGQGIGSALLRDLEEHLRARRYAMLLSSINGGEELALRWHRRNGFAESGRIKWVWTPLEEIVVSKPLG